MKRVGRASLTKRRVVRSVLKTVVYDSTGSGLYLEPAEQRINKVL
jgi:hypothetical protein